jgi:hypothetical protein
MLPPERLLPSKDDDATLPESNSLTLVPDATGPPSLDDAEEIYLTAIQVRKRFGGVTDMTLHRWLHDKTVGFPQPIYIGKHRYWKLTELLAYERRCVIKRTSFLSGRDLATRGARP